MCVHLYVQPCVCMCMYNHACAYVQYIHMHVHMHMYVPTHTFFFCLKDFEKFLSPPLFLLLLFLSLGLPLFLFLLRLTSMLIVSLPFILQLYRSWSITTVFLQVLIDCTVYILQYSIQTVQSTYLSAFLNSKINFSSS